jgi:hypothetical protein
MCPWCFLDRRVVDGRMVEHRTFDRDLGRMTPCPGAASRVSSPGRRLKTAYAPDMDQALTVAAIGVGGTVIVGIVGLWANVRNTNKTTEVSRRAVEVSQHAVEAAQRTVALTEQGQVTDRYTKAIEQLGSANLDVRIGGIYALERIAHDSARDHPTVMEVLAAFIREHSRELQQPSPEDDPIADVLRRRTLPDIQAAVTVIGRRSAVNDGQEINLTRVTLAGANLPAQTSERRISSVQTSTPRASVPRTSRARNSSGRTSLRQTSWTRSSPLRNSLSRT